VSGCRNNSTKAVVREEATRTTLQQEIDAGEEGCHGAGEHQGAHAPVPPQEALHGVNGGEVGHCPEGNPNILWSTHLVVFEEDEQLEGARHALQQREEEYTQAQTTVSPATCACVGFE
jgi:hypothetical protein